MRIQDYSTKALETAVYDGQGSTKGLLYTLIGLADEAGEALGHAKKILRGDDNGETDLAEAFGYCSEERREKILAELGDVAWYWALTIRELGGNPEAVLQSNLDKLAKRRREGTLKGDGDDR